MKQKIEFLEKQIKDCTSIISYYSEKLEEAKMQKETFEEALSKLTKKNEK